VGRSGGGSAGPQPGVADCALENVSRGASSPGLNPRFLVFLIDTSSSGATCKARAEARRSR
jgi:hypothetical protein